jgi:hypothetical protein
MLVPKHAVNKYEVSCVDCICDYLFYKKEYIGLSVSSCCCFD